MTTATDRAATFERLMEDYDAKSLAKTVDFTKHRYCSIERDAVSGVLYVKGHPNLRRACDHMARAVEEGEAMVPDQVLDLDTGEFTKVDLFVHVAPVTIEAVSVLLPRRLALEARESIQVGAEEGAPVADALPIFDKALQRRS